ncbi:MAG: hypothetical protein L6R42_002768 [Xanthoria sp. 1 TBL-2021]|nr:MAG: hypothetical protein L6R42_002768 [Xanthoria sp. 1 TBL-2021]
MGQSLSNPTQKLHSEATLTPPTPRCRLLELPAELRAEIFLYVLPTSTNSPIHGPRWIKGATALLRTSRRIYDEAAQLMYRRAAIRLLVYEDSTIFEYQGLFEGHHNLASSQWSREEYLRFITRFEVAIYLDTYEFKVGSGLTCATRDQLEALCKTLEAVPEIENLSLYFYDHFTVTKADETVLRPILDLENIQEIKYVGKKSNLIRQQLESSQS